MGRVILCVLDKFSPITCVTPWLYFTEEVLSSCDSVYVSFSFPFPPSHLYSCSHRSKARGVWDTTSDLCHDFWLRHADQGADVWSLDAT